MSIADRELGAQPPPSGMPPAVNLAPRDVEAIADELSAYHAIFTPLFWRAEQRQWSLKYLQGQMLDIERKSIEPMALALEGGNVQAMQQFIAVGAWDDELILKRHQELVTETLGDRDTGVLIIDGCDFPKQGTHSVGVARQWCGALGKVANCQASVLACYASERGYTLVDRRLYMPERWFGEAYRERRERYGVPSDLTFHTEPELAWEMIETLHKQGALPFRWVTFDEHFGNNPVLLDRVASIGLCYLAEVPHDTRVWLRRPRTEIPPAKDKGRRPSRERLSHGEPAAVRVDQLAKELPSVRWTRFAIKEGAKGPMVAEFAFVRAVAIRDDLPGPAVWVVLRRSLGEKQELKFYLSNAAEETPQEEFVRIAGMRWPVESAILESKSELGMDHYEVRTWVGWHHHMTMTLLAHHFLVRLRLRLGEKISRSHRAASASTTERGAAEEATRRQKGHSIRPWYATAELRRLPVPSQARPA
ncbi:MAG: IS701 family transposase [Chloroflexota bacterium]